MPIILGNAKETYSIGGRIFDWGGVQRILNYIFDWTGNLVAPTLYPALDPITGTPWLAMTGTAWPSVMGGEWEDVSGRPWSPIT